MVKSFFFIKNKSKIAFILTLSVSAIPFIVTQEAHFGGSHPNKSLRILGRDKEIEPEDLLSSIEDKYPQKGVSFRSRNKVLSASQEFEISKLQGITDIVRPSYKNIKITLSLGTFTRPKYLDVVFKTKEKDRVREKFEEKKLSPLVSMESFMEEETQREESLFENSSLSSMDLLPLFEEEDSQRNEDLLKAFSPSQFELLEPLNNFGIPADTSITRHPVTEVEPEDPFKGWEEKSVFSPINRGLIELSVKEGDFVREGAELCNIEVMKMFTAVRNFYGEGIYIKSVHVEKRSLLDGEETPIMTVLIPPKKSSAMLKEEDEETRS